MLQPWLLGLVHGRSGVFQHGTIASAACLLGGRGLLGWAGVPDRRCLHGDGTCMAGPPVGCPCVKGCVMHVTWRPVRTTMPVGCPCIIGPGLLYLGWRPVSAAVSTPALCMEEGAGVTARVWCRLRLHCQLRSTPSVWLRLLPTIPVLLLCTPAASVLVRLRATALLPMQQHRAVHAVVWLVCALPGTHWAGQHRMLTSLRGRLLLHTLLLLHVQAIVGLGH